MEFDIPHHHVQRRIFVPVLSLKWVFVLTPRAASNAILDALARHHGVEGVRTWQEPNIFPALTLDETRAMVGSWPRAMFVRHPLTRLISNYEYHVKRMKLTSSWTLRDLGFRADMSFEEFAERAIRDPEADEHLALQCWQSDRVDFVGHVEGIEQDWKRFRDLIGVDLPQLRSINTAPRNHGINSYFSQPLKVRAVRCYDPDLQAFGYKV